MENLTILSHSCRGEGDKPISCKPGAAGSIPGFSIKPKFGEPLGVPNIKATHKS